MNNCNTNSDYDADANDHSDSNAKIYSESKIPPFTGAAPVKGGINCGMHVAFSVKLRYERKSLWMQSCGHRSG
jgi:hypothetical protein